MNPEINPDALYWATFNRCQFRIPGQAVLDICHSGDNGPAVRLHLPEVQRLTAELYADNPGNPWNPTPERIRQELREYGAWDEDERDDDDQANWERLLWLAAWNIYEDEERDCSDPLPPASSPATV